MSKPEQEAILKQLKRIDMLWGDLQPSRDISEQLGSSTPGPIIMSTPQDIQETDQSRGKRLIMTPVEEALALLPYTNSFRRYLGEMASTAYNFGLPVENLHSFWGIDLENNNLGVLDLDHTQAIEKRYLNAAIGTACLRLVGGFGYFIPEEQEAKMTPKECAELVVKGFLTLGNGQIVSRQQIEQEHVEHQAMAMLPILDLRLSEIRDTVLWADEYRELHLQDSTFLETTDMLRPVAALAPQANPSIEDR